MRLQDLQQEQSLTNAQTITGTGAQVKAALITDAVTLGAASTATK